MTEEPFARIEGRLDEFVVGQVEMRRDIFLLRGDVTELRGDVTELRGDVTQLHGDVSELRGDVTQLRGDVTELRGDVTGLKTGHAELRRDFVALREHMGVLHEDVIANIKAIPDQTAQLQRMLRESVGELREEIGRRLDPLEEALRRHFRGSD